MIKTKYILILILLLTCKEKKDVNQVDSNDVQPAIENIQKSSQTSGFRIGDSLYLLELLKNAKHRKFNDNEIPWDTIPPLEYWSGVSLHENRVVSLDYAGFGAGSIPEGISTLSELISLNISDNDLTEFPDEITTLANLEKLDLTRNRISSLPGDIQNLVNLESLYVSENYLQKLPEEITNLNISELSIGDNRLEEVDLSQKVIEFLNSHDGNWNYQNVEKANKTDIHYSGSTTAKGKGVRIFPFDSMPFIFKSECKYVPSAGTYFALFGDQSRVWIDTVNVSVERGMYENFYEGERMGWFVRTPWSPEMLMILYGIPAIKNGPIKTWYLNKTWNRMEPGTDYSYPLQSELFKKSIALDGIGTFSMKAKLKYSCEQGCHEIESLQWSLRFGESKWVALPVIPPTTAQPSWAVADDAILWIGDLNNDNKPDVLMSPVLGPVANYRYYQLFLSNQLNPGHLWRSAATFFHYPPTTGD